MTSDILERLELLPWVIPSDLERIIRDAAAEIRWLTALLASKDAALRVVADPKMWLYLAQPINGANFIWVGHGNLGDPMAFAAAASSTPSTEEDAEEDEGIE